MFPHGALIPGQGIEPDGPPRQAPPGRSNDPDMHLRVSAIRYRRLAGSSPGLIDY